MRRLAYVALVVIVGSAPACTSRNPAASGDGSADAVRGRDGQIGVDGRVLPDGTAVPDAPVVPDARVRPDAVSPLDGVVRPDAIALPDGTVHPDNGVNCNNVQCPAPTCHYDATSGLCTATASTCDPATGACQSSGTGVKRSCTQNGTTCVQNTPGCTSTNRCALQQRSVANATCNQSTGLCTPNTNQCTVDCDCNQGFLCAQGQCIAGFVPTYCCDKSGCPANQRCTDSNGNPGYCPGTNPCVAGGGYCVVQFSPCRKGTKRDASLSCGGALSLDCCVPNP